MKLALKPRDAWSRRLSDQVGSSAAVPVCGVEHEFVVTSESGTTLDARTVLPTLSAGRNRHDPIDPYARTLDDGAVLTADGREAEIAIAPVAVQPGFSQRAGAAAAAARRTLEGSLPQGARVEGFSTHLSVEVRDRRAPDIARFVAERFAPLLMLGLETPASPGLLVRARWNRVEIGGDYADGPLLQAALVIAVACVRGSSRSVKRRLPPKPAMALEPAVERYGWYVDRTSSGSDLYSHGRSGILQCGHGQMTVQDYVTACWIAIEPAVSGASDHEELARAHDLVAGRLRSALDR